MPETIIESPTPLKSAIAQVTSNGRDSWKRTDWTYAKIPQNQNEHFKFHDPISADNATTGMRGSVTHPNGTTRNFTIRHDWDFAHGGPPAGKGYHVNVELPNEKYAFTQPTGSQGKYLDCVQMLSERRLHDGDEAASRWFMKETDE
ncbi:MAG: hypothetical protein Q9193_005840 [Seirophora villosa]